jgi:DNA-directed RNA polymerase specialized sigma24 family protein
VELTMGGGGEIEPDLNSRDRSAPLDTLLDRLASGSDVAPAYEQLRMRLVTFFRLRFPVEAEALADEAIDRLARRLDDGTQVDNPASYALGIARFLLLEASTRQRKEAHAAREAMLELELQAPDTESDPALPALRACLDSIDPESARLILEYYAVDDDRNEHGDGESRIERRQRLAARLGMTLNALRNRALRTRLALEKCIRGRLAADSGQPDGDIPSKTNTRDMMRHPPHDRPRDDAHD